MPSKIAETSQKGPAVRTFCGDDGLQGWVAMGYTLALNALAALVLYETRGGWAAIGAVAVAPLLLVVARRGARYRLRIGPEVELVRTFWGLPYARHRWPLDEPITLYEAWEDDVAEGVAIEPRSRLYGPYPDAELFGPYSGGRDASRLPAIQALYEEVTAALEVARQAVPLTPRGLEIDGQRLLDEEIEGRHPSGRVQAATLRAPRRIMGLDLPARTRLECNIGQTSGWVHPDRPDELDAVRAPVALPAPGGARAAPGARVRLDSRGRVREAEAVEVAPVVHGLSLDKDRPIGWDEQGRVDLGTLAEAASVGPLELRRGDLFEFKRLAPGVSVRLGGPRVLAGRALAAGDSALLDVRWGRLELRAVITHEGGQTRLYRWRFGRLWAG